MQLFAPFLAVAAAAAPALAVSATAFSGFNCVGTALTVPCDGSCHPFSGKNSFRVDADTVEHCVGSFTGTACNSGTLAFPNPNQNGECTNIEASSPILSFSCSPNNTCTGS